MRNHRFLLKLTVNGNPKRDGAPSAVKNMNPHDTVYFDPSLQPRDYHIKSDETNSKVLFRGVNIIDSTGRDPFKGDVYIEGGRIKHVGHVPDIGQVERHPSIQVIHGRGRTLMSGLGDAHTHLTWNNGDLGALGDLGVEEHTLLTAQSAKCYLDSGYTMCFGAASAKDRLDCVIRDAINEGSIPGPRYLANGKEIAVPDGELVPSITAFAKGPDEMRKVVGRHIGLGADTIKLSMSGEQICETRDAQDCYFSDADTAACVAEAHSHGIRVCGHARARDSVNMCIRHGVDVIYHASWIDDEGMDMLEKAKHKHIVAPGINWLVATIYEGGAFGYSFEKAEKMGYKKELDAAVKALKEMHKRGITILPGGDYGFAWTPHGTYARDLEHFVKLLGFTPMESIVAATAGVAKLFMREHELGKIKPGYLADCILVDGDPLADISILQDHAKLSVIMINGRLHKSGTAVEDLYQLIEVGETNVISSGDDTFALNDGVEILAPLRGRDVLAIGKNYSEHAKEFNASGYDSSDKNDMPTHPVVFTKRSTSIVAHNSDILLHSGFTSTLDYEGEIGVIIGKGGFRISSADADAHVWGYTIINDVTAREKQRDHKQFFIGKSADSYCPMGPMAVPKAALPAQLTLTTHVNGELRQKGTMDDLIFSVPKLIETLSESQTLRPGDVIATGTPAGVGFGLSPPVFLKPGDVVEIAVTGLGKLRNTVVEAKADNYVTKRVQEESVIPINNLSITNGGLGLTELPNGKRLHAKVVGSGPQVVVFIHGLGGSGSFFTPLLTQLGLNHAQQCTNVLFDLEGHGMSPTKATSKISISSYAEDIRGLLTTLRVSEPVTIVAHSMGCLVAYQLASQYPDLVSKLILLGPPPAPFPTAAAEGCIKRAAVVRAQGMTNVAIAVAEGGTSKRTQLDRPLAFTAVQMSLLSQDSEGYAKGCTALAGAQDLTFDFAKLGEIKSLLVTGSEDKVSSPDHVRKLAETMKNSTLEILPDVGHWHIFEDVDSVAGVVNLFM
ncbi:hypothetical protein N0V82_006907 [Gnomoniopsis sp. IMI 355080]|nr:hypothetical protein N0V82_006907 [Gnomoniopsis sp. IMI 355080]